MLKELGLLLSPFRQPVSVFVFVRVFIIFTLFYLGRGSEISDDSQFQWGLIQDPFSILGGWAQPSVASYAPLTGFLQGWLAYPLSLLFGKFIALRLTYFSFEFMALCLFISAMRDQPYPFLSRWVWAWSLLPSSLITTAFMSQDETMGVFFLTALLWALSRGQKALALFMGGLGTIAVKVFLMVPLLPMLVLFREIKARIFWGLGPIFFTYGIVVLAVSLGSGHFPFISHPSSGSFGIGIGTWFPQVHYQTLKKISVLFVLFFGCLPVFLERKRTQTSPLQIVHLGTVCLLWVFAFFYQCNPEYYNLLTPGLLTFCSNWVSLGLLGGVLLLPWLANYGYAVYMSTLYPFGPGKKALVQPFFSLNLLSPLAFKSLTLGMSTAMTFGIAIWATYFYWRRYVFEGKSF